MEPCIYWRSMVAYIIIQISTILFQSSCYLKMYCRTFKNKKSAYKTNNSLTGSGFTTEIFTEIVQTVWSWWDNLFCLFYCFLNPWIRRVWIAQRFSCGTFPTVVFHLCPHIGFRHLTTGWASMHANKIHWIFVCDLIGNWARFSTRETCH